MKKNVKYIDSKKSFYFLNFNSFSTIKIVQKFLKEKNKKNHLSK